MTTEVVARRSAAAMLLRLAKTDHGRRFLADAGHRTGQPIIVVLESDTLGQVFGRLFDEQPEAPALLSVYWPSDKPSLTFVSIHPDELGAEVEEQSVAHSSTIGMLCTTMRANKLSAVNVQMRTPAIMSASLHSHEMASV